jgi:hypothetical protein
MVTVRDSVMCSSQSCHHNTATETCGQWVGHFCTPCTRGPRGMFQTLGCNHLGTRTSESLESELSDEITEVEDNGK